MDAGGVHHHGTPAFMRVRRRPMAVGRGVIGDGGCGMASAAPILLIASGMPPFATTARTSTLGQRRAAHTNAGAGAPRRLRVSDVQ
jgi:hypothetical protein